MSLEWREKYKYYEVGRGAFHKHSIGNIFLVLQRTGSCGGSGDAKEKEGHKTKSRIFGTIN